MKLDIKATKNFMFLMNSKKKIKLLEGSTRSGKTYAIMQYLILKAYEKKRTITCCRYDSSTCNDTIIVDFQEIMTEFGIYNPTSFNKTEKRYQFPNGSVMNFIGTQNEAKLHGRKQDILYLNEVMEILYGSFNQLAPRTTESIICDWNPSLKVHWVFTNVKNRPDCEYCHSTYKVNPFLKKEQVWEIESKEPTEENYQIGTADEHWWQVYGLGLQAVSKGLVYKSYNVVDDMPDIEHRKNEGSGCDFGFTNDPSSLVHCCLFNGEIYLDEVVYKTGLVSINNDRNNSPSIECEANANGFDKKLLIFADSASPQSIHELNSAGFWVNPVKKGPNSIIEGISIINQYKINVTRRSKNLINELDSYRYPEDKRTGELSNKPLDKDNHGMDAFRYWAMSMLRKEQEPRSLVTFI